MQDNKIDYEEVTGLAYRVASNYIYDKDSAKDIAQLTAIECYMNAEKLKEKSLNSWIYVVAKHKSIDYINKRKKDNKVLDKEIAELDKDFEKEIEDIEDIDDLLKTTPNKVIPLKQKQYLELVLNKNYDYKVVGRKLHEKPESIRKKNI